MKLLTSGIFARQAKKTEENRMDLRWRSKSKSSWNSPHIYLAYTHQFHFWTLVIKSIFYSRTPAFIFSCTAEKWPFMVFNGFSNWRVWNFLKIFWKIQVLFVRPLMPLFWTSGDVSSGFQSQSGQSYSYLLEAYVLHVRWNLRVWNYKKT